MSDEPGIPLGVVLGAALIAVGVVGLLRRLFARWDEQDRKDR